MEDSKILDLYWERKEAAILETDRKYRDYCMHIAINILSSYEDSEECVNDTWLKAWDLIPPARPANLKAWLGKITRNLSLDRYFYNSAKKRGAGQIPLVLEELKDLQISGTAGSTPPQGQPELAAEAMVVNEVLNHFLGSLKTENRVIFMRRYWYLDSIRDIAEALKISESKVKVSLFRSRKKLRQILQEEGVWK